MAEKDWLTLVAVHSDAWLIAVAFYVGARFGFDKDARSGLLYIEMSLYSISKVQTSRIRLF
jgi:hypothetical protein